MWNAIANFLDSVFIGPMWPASILMGLLLCYLLLSLFGAVDLDFGSPDADLDLDIDLPDAPDADFDVDVDAGPDLHLGQGAGDLFGGMGVMTLRWLNLGRVPILIWGGTFTLVFWSVSWLIWNQFDFSRYEPTLVTSIWLVARNFVISVGLTKLVTGPMAKIFAPEPQYDAATIVGQTCIVWSSRADGTFGQARYKTDAAPLLLNVRTDGSLMKKGDPARIVSFDAEKRIYVVTQVDSELQS